ncbi:uncharacterized protein LOC114143538 isoform X1 [Xiphophorus couchianus]|uniref:uncharacterized protein LOC114143538 isoform X1 n=2 Tax=Xiphophorus couchianus TaxID=32473 RepID=UPI001016AC0D|nr:uncharacterized protein LOC114143538 isoform X1 [Xiphophorus couchianus]
MSVELCPVSEPDGNNETTQDFTLGGNKPLHRFLRCQPKVIGTVMLVIGASSVIVAIATHSDVDILHMWMVIPPEICMGILLTICGILYIVTQHRPTKKTVTISFALSIVSTLGGFWTILVMLINFHIYYAYSSDEEHNNDTDIANEIPWTSHIEVMGLTLEAVFLLYSFVGTIIFITMSVLAGAALRSTKTQAIVVMTTTAAEAPVE